MLRHYGAYGIYWEFGDVVYVMILATTICNKQMMTMAPCTINHVTAGVTKTDGLSNTLWVQKGQWAEKGSYRDT